MRTLKRTLCLVLAMVMVLGMFGIASATSFKDDAKVQYKEAVDVMTGIGSINGMGDGTFNPAGNVTRAQAAKMVAYAVLGADVAKNLPVTASSFKDVDSNFAWATPSIEYLVKKGVINGRGNGTFDPNGNITAYEIAKMLLCAAGYGKNGEYTGNSWALNVAITAQKKGVFTGSKTTDRNAAATREECALYCFNGLTKVAQVAYNKNTSNYDPTADGTIAADVYKLGTATAATGLAKVEKTVNGQTGYYWYYKNATTPISAFITDEAVIGSSFDGTALSTLTTYSTTNTKYIASINSNATFYLNGTQLKTGVVVGGTGTKAAEGVTYYTDATCTTEATVTVGTTDVSAMYVYDVAATLATAQTSNGNGVLIDLIDTDDNTKNAEKVYITTYTVDKVEKAPVVKTNTADGKDYVFVDMAGTDIGTSAVNTVLASNVTGYNGLAKDDVVLVYKFANGTYNVVKATPFTGKATASTSATLTIDGKTFKFAKAANASISSFASANFYKEFAFFTDSNGYLVAAAAVETVSTNFLMVLENDDYATGTFTSDSNKSAVVFDDGTTGIITVSAVDTKKWADGTLLKADVVEGDVYAYVKGSDGTYALISQTEVKSTAATTSSDPDGSITKGVSAITCTAGGANNTKGDANTKYVYRDIKTAGTFAIDYKSGGTGNETTGTTYKTTWTACTGYTNSMTATAAYYVAVNDTNGYADVVFVKNYKTTASATDTGVFYLLDANPTTVYKAAGVVDYYTFPALVNGQKTTVKAKLSDLTTSGLAKAGNTIVAGHLCYATYTDGYLTKGSVVMLDATGTAIANGAMTKTGFIKDTVIAEPANGLITIGSTGYNYTDSTYVFVISDDMQTVTPGLASSIVSGTYDNVTAVTVAATLDTPANATAAQQNTIYAIFIQQ